MSKAAFLLSVIALCFAFNRGGGGWKELRKQQKHSGHTKHIAQTRKEKRRNACSIAICHFANARKFRLLFFIMWIIHMIVLEASSYEELLEHLKYCCYRVILWEFTESPVNSSKLHPWQESQKNTFCLYINMRKKGWACYGYWKEFVCF